MRMSRVMMKDSGMVGILCVEVMDGSQSYCDGIGFNDKINYRTSRSQIHVKA